MLDAEHRFLDAHQEMLSQVDDPQLHTRLKEHVEETRGHIKRLETIFGQLGKEANRVTCPVARGLVQEYHETAGQSTADRDVLESVVATMMSKIEFYEMATYRSLITNANELGHTDAVALLRQTLSEEQTTSNVIDDEAPELSDEADDTGK